LSSVVLGPLAWTLVGRPNLLKTMGCGSSRAAKVQEPSRYKPVAEPTSQLDHREEHTNPFTNAVEQPFEVDSRISQDREIAPDAPSHLNNHEATAWADNLGDDDQELLDGRNLDTISHGERSFSPSPLGSLDGSDNGIRHDRQARVMSVHDRCVDEERYGGNAASSPSNLHPVRDPTEHAESARMLLEGQYDVGFTPLTMAAFNGHVEALHVLLEAKADVNTPDMNGATPLCLAAQNGHMDATKLLLQAKADVNKADETNSTALLKATQNGFIEVCRMLLEARADVNAPDKSEASPLLISTSLEAHQHQDSVSDSRCAQHHNHVVHGNNVSFSQYRNEAAVRALPEEDENMPGPQRIAVMPLDMAAKKRPADAVRQELQGLLNADDTATVLPASHPIPAPRLAPALDGIETIELLRAAKRGNLDVVRRLLQNQADVNATRQDGVTALFKAAKRGHTEAVKMLLDCKADMNAANKHGAGPLFACAANGHAEALQTLIHARANVDSPNRNGASALYVCAQNGHIDAVRILIEAQADINACKQDGVTPLFKAAQHNHIQVLRMLLDAGADTHATNKNGAGPLFMTAQRGLVDAMRYVCMYTRDMYVCIHLCICVCVTVQTGLVDVVRYACMYARMHAM
jgi:ankyrin repeat protein